MASVGERALHRMAQSLYAERGRNIAADVFLRPREVLFTLSGFNLLREYLIEVSLGMTTIFAEVRGWTSGATGPIGLRLRTRTIATPPVLITTGTANYVGAAPSDIARPDFSTRAIPEGAWNVHLTATVAPNVSGTRRQLLQVEAGLLSSEVVPRIYVQAVSVYELPLTAIG